MTATATAADLASLGQQKYVLLTTFRRTGAAVSTPVWVVPFTDGHHLAVITTLSTGKCKRLAHTPRVLLAPCDQRGRRRGDDLAAVAVVETGPTAERVQQLVRNKYGLLARAIQLVGRLRGRTDAAAVLISVASA